MLKDALAFTEKGLRTGAKVLYALNQSRAKVVLDPVYFAVAAALLGDTEPSPRLMEASIPPNLYFAFRAQSRKLQYFIEDWDWTEANPELLTRRQREMMHTVALGETSGAAVGDGFLRSFRTSPELAAFFGTWFVEELNHFLGYHLYLEKMRERWPVERGLEVAETEFQAYAEEPMEVAACNMYQELLGFLVYRSFSTQVKDPFLARMLAQFAKDELRHYKFYQQVVARQLQRKPAFRRTVLKVFLKATSPYNQVSGGVGNVLHHLEAGAFYFRKPELDFFLREVRYLLGTDLRGFFEWMFKGLIEPCGKCGNEPYRCECEDFEAHAAPPTSTRADWWQRPRRKLTPEEAAVIPQGGFEEMLRELRARRRAA